MYVIGLISITSLPILVIVDCIKPILGRGPNEKPRKKPEEAKASNQSPRKTSVEKNKNHVKQE